MRFGAFMLITGLEEQIVSDGRALVFGLFRNRRGR
jgi:hypothetical protein